MPIRKGVAEQSVEHEQAGAFISDGCYRPDLGWSAQGPIHALVAALVRRRRAGTLTPRDAAAIISNANGSLAFPWAGQWETCSLWPLVWTATSAEETVKRAGNSGYGTKGEGAHWCSGGRWADGTDAGCSDPGHRAVQSVEQVRELVAIILQHLATLPRLLVSGKTPPPPTPTPQTDESWPGWVPAGFQP